jgi:hypothetical protein
MFGIRIPWLEPPVRLACHGVDAAVHVKTGLLPSAVRLYGEFPNLRCRGFVLVLARWGFAR